MSRFPGYVTNSLTAYLTCPLIDGLHETQSVPVRVGEFPGYSTNDDNGVVFAYEAGGDSGNRDIFYRMREFGEQ